MVDSDDTSTDKDVPPWLQPVPDDEGDSSFFAANRKTIIMASIAAVLLAVFVGAIAVLYQDAPDGPPRRVTADAGPVKERPAEAGGMEVDHQDKSVLEIGDGTKAKPSIAIGEQPEQPVKEIPDLPVEKPAELPAEQAKVEDAIGDLAEAATQPAATPAANAPAPQAAETPEPQKAAAVNTAPAGSFMVQLGAYGSETTAASAWRALKGKFSRQLGDLEPVYVPVQSGDRTLYRLRVGPIDTRSRADEVCISLRAQDQACFVAGS